MQLYSSDEWEEFIREYVTGLPDEYVQVKRFGGAGDKGADIAAFRTDVGFDGDWDCYQGKHYDKPLGYANAAPEILKVVHHVAMESYSCPKSYFFMAPRGCGTSLNQLLSSPSKLKQKFLSQLVDGDKLVRGFDQQWIESLVEVAEALDFKLFKSIEIEDAIDVHRRTRYHSSRFGTPLAPRMTDPECPDQIDLESETRYITQLLAVYSERYPEQGLSLNNLPENAKVGERFRRQRRRFYGAESLRMYARESVPPETFERLQDDVHSGVIDTAEADHSSAYDRLSRVLALVGQLDLSRHRLLTRSSLDELKGICHQLVNVGRMSWNEDA